MHGKQQLSDCQGNGAAPGPIARAEREARACSAVTLTEEFLKTDPPAAEEMMGMSASIRRHLQQVVARVGKDGELVGIGGTVSAILTLLRKNEGGDPREFNQTSVSFETLSAL